MYDILLERYTADKVSGTLVYYQFENKTKRFDREKFFRNEVYRVCGLESSSLRVM